MFTGALVDSNDDGHGDDEAEDEEQGWEHETSSLS